MNVHHLLTHYGYAAVFVLVAAGSLGIPLPGETILIAAAIYAGATRHLPVWLIFAVATIAAIIGDNIGLWIGDKGGYRLLRRYGHYVRADDTSSVTAVLLWPARREMSSSGMPLSDSRETKLCCSSRGAELVTCC